MKVAFVFLILALPPIWAASINETVERVYGCEARQIDGVEMLDVQMVLQNKMRQGQVGTPIRIVARNPSFMIGTTGELFGLEVARYYIIDGSHLISAITSGYTFANDVVNIITNNNDASVFTEGQMQVASFVKDRTLNAFIPKTWSFKTSKLHN